LVDRAILYNHQLDEQNSCLFTLYVNKQEFCASSWW